ncbi:glycosyltransferase [Halobacillus seohaensis]|uniref:Glycosyltransferase n=2 Tax=Halobacillus seohaensis TaxID=447421 RepID=A0ABW2ER16_9BACI
MTINFQEISLIIPAYNPDNKLIELVNELSSINFNSIIVVDDGSSTSNHIFNELKDKQNCIILHHEKNKGKGRALKTAFSYVQKHQTNITGMLTADADGQHSIPDIKKVAESLLKHPNNLILGVRDFKKENIPLRSRFGNNLTKLIFRITSGLNIRDTQTGLRGIPLSFSKHLLNVDGERYEFETRMILASKDINCEISEVEIDTIYIDDNSSSHFNPILDSLKIYYIFIRFLLSSVASFILDVGLFTLFSAFLKTILPGSFIIISTILARVFSSLFNYFVNRNIVFKSTTYTKVTLIKYYTLAVFILGASSISVHYTYQFIGDHEVIIKVLIDSILFLMSFYIQRTWIFNKKQATEGEHL